MILSVIKYLPYYPENKTVIFQKFLRKLMHLIQMLRTTIKIYSKMHSFFLSVSSFQIYIFFRSINKVVLFSKLYGINPFLDECDMCFPLPTILHHQISTGQTMYSIMYQPPNLDVRRKYPVVLNIYGGPDFQLVTNTFKVQN